MAMVELTTGEYDRIRLGTGLVLAASHAPAYGDENVCAAAEDERRLDLAPRNTGERRMAEIGLDARPVVDPIAFAPPAAPIARSSGTGMTCGEAPGGARCPRARGAPRADRAGRWSPSRCTAGSPCSRTRATGRKPSPRFASVSGQTQMAAPDSASRASSFVVSVRAVDDRRLRPEAAGSRQELDRADAVLGEAFLDLLGLLVRVDMQHEALALGVAADLFEPFGGARPDGVGGEADRAPAARSSSTWPRYSDTEACRNRSSPPRPYAESRRTSSIPAAGRPPRRLCASRRPT